MKKIVLVDFHVLPMPHQLDVERWIALGAEVVDARCRTITDFLEAGRDAQVLVCCGTQLSLTAGVLEKLPQCTLVLRLGVGYDTVDVEAATRLGILVANCAGYCTEDVANHALALVLMCSQQIPLHQAAVRAGKWFDAQLPFETQRLSQRTLGLVGLGQIGTALASKVQPLVDRILAHDPNLANPAAIPCGVELVALETLLREADLVSLHLPLNPQTRGLIGRRELGLMKPSAYLINTARGPIVDQEALYQALIRKQLAGVALDVVEVEPPPQPLHELFFLPNVVITPHYAAGSAAARRDLWQIATENVALFLQGHRPRNTVNPQVQPRFTS